MTIIIAMDSFKGSLSSLEAAEAVCRGIHDVRPEMKMQLFPLSDGGEGLTETIVSVLHGKYRRLMVTGPLGEKVEAAYGLIHHGRTAVIEAAEACGLALVPKEKQNPLYTQTCGIGEMIADAIRNGSRDFIIGLGGTATNDAGIGMLTSLGWQFTDKNGNEAGTGGAALEHIFHIDSSKVPAELQECRFQIACDVDNPLFGSNGAAVTFAPQKGANAEAVAQLDKGLRVFAEISSKVLGKEIAYLPGAGAAGGLGAAFAAYLQGELCPGIELVLERLELAKYMKDAQLVITGEGRLDTQTARGKAPLGIARLAAEYKVPVVAFAGSVEETADDTDTFFYNNGLTACFPIVSKPMSLEQAMNKEQTQTNLRQSARQLMQLLQTVSPQFSK